MRVALTFILLLYPLVKAEAGPLDYKIEHKRTALVMNWDGKTLKARDRHLDIALTKKECNKKILEDFFTIDAQIWKEIPAEKPDTLKVVKNGKTFFVAGQSRLGGHLLTLSTKLKYLAAESERLCPLKAK